MGRVVFIGKRPAEFAADTLWQCVGSTRELVGVLPTGTADDLLSMFWSIRLDAIEAWRNTPLDQWKRSVLALAPQAESLLNQIESRDQIATASYNDVRMKLWHGNRVAVLGDAAHALSPQLGQGINLALMDAAALAEAVGRYPLPQALEMYSNSRRKHLRFYQFASRWTTPFFQSDHVSLGWLRDATFPIMNRIPILRRQMTEVMQGAKTGIFSRL